MDSIDFLLNHIFSTLALQERGEGGQEIEYYDSLFTRQMSWQGDINPYND